MDIDISIIIVNYNTPELTTQCVQSIITYTKWVSYEIIVVDNGSKPESKDYFDENLLFIPQLNIVYTEKNLGFGWGNNIWYTHSKWKYLFFLNSDTILTENSIKILYDIYRTKEEFTKMWFLAPKLFYDPERHYEQPFGTKVPWFIDVLLYNTPWLKYFRRGRYNRFRYAEWDRKTEKEIGNAWGPVFMVSRNCFGEIGKFDERFFLYMEEFDTAKRLKKLWYHSYFTPATSIIHLENRSPQIKRRKTMTSFVSMRKYFWKYI